MQTALNAPTRHADRYGTRLTVLSGGNCYAKAHHIPMQFESGDGA